MNEKTFNVLLWLVYIRPLHDFNFRSGKNFSTTYAIVITSTTFFSNLSMKISNFSKTVYTTFIKFCSHYRLKGAPACAMASQSYNWDVRNITKISPKKTKKVPFLDFFNFRKTCPYDSYEIFYGHSTPYYGPICALASNCMTGMWEK